MLTAQALTAELRGQRSGVVTWIAGEFGIGTESSRGWQRQAGISDGLSNTDAFPDELRRTGLGHEDIPQATPTSKPAQLSDHRAAGPICQLRGADDFEEAMEVFRSTRPPNVKES